MSADPASAPPRPDITFLRHRTRRLRRAGSSDLGEFLAGHQHHAPAHPPAPPPVPVATPAPAVTPTAAPASSSLDLDASPAPARQPAAPSPSPSPASSSSLDLDAGHASTAPARAAAPRPARAVRKPHVARVPSSGRLVLDAATPSMAFTRVQSGIGTLTVEGAWSGDAGSLRLGCAFRLRSAGASVVSATGEYRLAPPNSRRPVLVAGRDRFDRLLIDLRQVRDVERLMVYAYTEDGSDVTWGGTLLVTDHAGARVEAPLLGLDAGSVGVLLSIYQADGELALWTEMLAGRSVRDACRAFGFDDITWLDDHTPLT